MMELQQFTTTFPFFLIFLLLLFTIVKQSKKKSTIQFQTSRLPPSPSKLPVIGHLHHLLGPPHRVLKDLAKLYGPLMYLKLGEIPTVIISSPGVAKLVLKTHDLMFVDRPETLFGKIFFYGNADVILAPYGDYWRQLKKICISELLSAKRVQSFWSIREEETSNLITSISMMAGSRMNLSDKFFTLTTDITARATFGKGCSEKQAFLAAMKEVITLTSSFSLADLFPSRKFLQVTTGNKSKLERIHLIIDKILEDILRAHRENLKDTEDADVEKDLVDVLLRIKEQNELEFPITLENVKAVILDMFSAGTDSSSTVIEWIFVELLRNPRVMTKAQAEVRRAFNGKTKIDKAADLNELHYMRLVIKEALRLHTPAPLLVPRICRQTCEIEGYEIPKGCQVLVNAWAIARDPENWQDPESFKPERFLDLYIDYKGNNFEYIPFGAGRRMCPGILFGIANIELPLSMLLYHFDWKLADGVIPNELDMSETFGTTVRRKHDLYVIATPYTP